MLNRMREYISSGYIREALIVGRNLFAHDPGNKEVFSAFHSALLSASMSAKNSDEKLHYFQQMSSALVTK